MADVNVVIDGLKVSANDSQTILEVAIEQGIQIPTLCHDRRLKPFNACWVCVVEVEGRTGFIPACSTLVTDGMVIQTDNERLRATRRLCLELLLSNHYGDCIAPCQLACPAGVDVQGYIALIANGRYSEAVELMKETIPLPAVIGRVCPRPCEKECRRNIVDETVAICHLKRFAADHASPKVSSRKKPQTVDKRPQVAVVGSGPAGLSAGYYLARLGYSVTVFEAQSEAGGMLRYGIPEYRLPKAVLDREIASIKEEGVNIETSCVLGRDFTVGSLLEKGFKSVFLATGAQEGISLGIEGEDLEGVMLGIDFLRAAASGKPVPLGKNVVVVGGGNTAVDAARTALRLGAGKVTVIYRRSRKEMPAEEREVRELEREGVELRFLVAPLKINGQDGKVVSVECIKMALGEPDASGRRRPEPIPGSEFLLEADTAIAAIGQRPDLSFLREERSSIQTTKWGTVSTNPDTLQTAVGRVFAGGDIVSGGGTVVEAVAAGRRAALSIDRYLQGQPLSGWMETVNVSSKGKLEELSKDEFKDVEPVPCKKMRMLPVKRRLRNFREVELGYGEGTAREEASRCMACGCDDVFECTLHRLAVEYQADARRFKGEMQRHDVDNRHPFIRRNLDLCILCGRCVRICDEVMAVKCINFAYRGFNTYVSTEFNRALQETTCVSCGQCVGTCPTGALTEKVNLPKAGPWVLEKVLSICPYCGVGCSLHLNVKGKIFVKATSADGPVNHDNLCVKGRFGLDFINQQGRLTKPLVRRRGKLVETSWEEAFSIIAKKFSDIKSEHGSDSLAVFSSPRCTNEENYLMQKLARAVLGTNNIDSFSYQSRLAASGLTEAFGLGASPNSFDEVEESSLLLLVNSDVAEEQPIFGLKLRKALERGAKLVVINSQETGLAELATVWLKPNPGTNVALFNGMAHVIVGEGLQNHDFISRRTEGYTELRNLLEKYTPSRVSEVTGIPAEKIIEVARLYAKSRDAMMIFNADAPSPDSRGEVQTLCNLALLTGHIARKSAGIIALRGKNNSQGLDDMGVTPSLHVGYQPVENPEVKARFEKCWGAKLPDRAGMNTLQIAEGIRKGKVRGVYILGADPLGSTENPGKVRPLLGLLEFLVVQDLFLTETAKLADVVLPATSFAETDGTFTNSERRVQRLNRAVQPLTGMENWQVICSLAQAMGYPMRYSSTADIMEEISSLAPIFSGISFERLEDELQWPCSEGDSSGTRVLYEGEFGHPDGRARFKTVEQGETVGEGFPIFRHSADVVEIRLEEDGKRLGVLR